ELEVIKMHICIGARGIVFIIEFQVNMLCLKYKAHEHGINKGREPSVCIVNIIGNILNRL
ncbi:MAG TPA: hypothetical protein VFF49_05355, partial [Thermodesulfobacteriota bacterium]|nr:hypothetical protein [Thermodesulfobacteriota bacterium]